jgi:subtilisin family serine protease
MKLTLIHARTGQPVVTAKLWRKDVFDERHVPSGEIYLSSHDLRRFYGSAVSSRCILEFEAPGFFQGQIELSDTTADRAAVLHEITDHLPPWWQGIADFGRPLENAKKITIGVIDSGCGFNPLLNHVRRYRVETQDVEPHLICRPETSIVDHVGHGTNVIGLIGARDRLKVGFSGCLPGANIISVRFTDEWSANAADAFPRIAAAMDFLTQERVDIINLSLKYPAFLAEGISCLEEALNAGIVLVAAAGNDGVPTLEFPAAHPGVIAISAFGHANRTLPDTITFLANEDRVERTKRRRPPHYRWHSSNYSDTKEFWFPGAGVYSTWPHPPGSENPSQAGFHDLDGTSMACGVATGTIAHIMQREAAALDSLSGRARVAKVEEILRSPEYSKRFTVHP